MNDPRAPMTPAPLDADTQRRLAAKATRLAARIWRVCQAETQARTVEVPRQGAPEGAPPAGGLRATARHPEDDRLRDQSAFPPGGRATERVVALSPEALTVIAVALGLVSGRIIAGGSDRTGHPFIETAARHASARAAGASFETRAAPAPQDEEAGEAAAHAEKLN